MVSQDVTEALVVVELAVQELNQEGQVIPLLHLQLKVIMEVLEALHQHSQVKEEAEEVEVLLQQEFKDHYQHQILVMVETEPLHLSQVHQLQEQEEAEELVKVVQLTLQEALLLTLLEVLEAVETEKTELIYQR